MRHSPQSLRMIVCFLLAGLIINGALSRPLQAGVWDDVKEWLLLYRLSGGGQFMTYERNVDTKDPQFPLMVLNDGYKMVRVYQDLPGVYMVEWAWRVTIKNRVPRDVRFALEYKLQDADLFLVTSSQAPARTISPGQTVSVEKTEILPYEKARSVKNSNWYIHLQ